MKFRNSDMSAFGTVSLGGLIKELERFNPKNSVCYDSWGLHPTTVNSYRGYYDHLAIGYSVETEIGNLEALIIRLKECEGKTFTGYKGGTYTMKLNTPIWVANYGETGFKLIGLIEKPHNIILLTEQNNDF